MSLRYERSTVPTSAKELWADDERRARVPAHQEPRPMTPDEVQRKLNVAIEMLNQAQRDVHAAVRKVYAVPRYPLLDESVGQASRAIEQLIIDVRSFAGRKRKQAAGSGRQAES